MTAPREDVAALMREVDHYRDLLADAYVTIGCAVESEDGLDGSEADRFHAAVRRLWPAAVDHPTIAKWNALPEEGSVRASEPTEQTTAQKAMERDALIAVLRGEVPPHSHAEGPCDCGPEGWGLTDDSADAITVFRKSILSSRPADASEPLRDRVTP